MGIPAVVAVRGLLDAVVEGALVGLDGDAGRVYVEPDEATVAQLQAAAAAWQARHEQARARAGRGPTVTVDGCRVEVAANIRGVEELRAALAEEAEGVGLLRTELLFVDRDRPPTLDDQIALLRAMRELLGDRRLVVRTFDIGSDKAVPFLPVRPERNPELGVRGIRLAQVHPDLLETQLEAVAAVAASGPTAVMAPMVATVAEVDWFVERVAKTGLREALEVGVMVEVPSAVLLAPEVASRVDFVSIGTNDLGQYLHAADRRHPTLAALQDPFDPAMLRAVDLVCRGAQGHAWVGVCGEAAADPGWAGLAVGLGVSELSMRAASIPVVRGTVRWVA
jgi:phosphoenolpyruvate-protein kinase (PTS system EI component)